MEDQAVAMELRCRDLQLALDGSRRQEATLAAKAQVGCNRDRFVCLAGRSSCAIKGSRDCHL